jgi:hypothetical protein
MIKSLPLVTEHQGFKLKRLGFNWKVNCYYNEVDGLTETITNSGVNYNSGNLYEFNTVRYRSIPTVALDFRWLEQIHGIYLGKDWIQQEFELLDFRSENPISPIAIVEISDEHNTTDDATSEVLDLALDYLVKAVLPYFGDVVKLTNGFVGRCIGNNKALYIEKKENGELLVGDVDIESLQTHGKNFETTCILPSDAEVDKLRIPEFKK